MPRRVQAARTRERRKEDQRAAARPQVRSGTLERSLPVVTTAGDDHIVGGQVDDVRESCRWKRFALLRYGEAQQAGRLDALELFEDAARGGDEQHRAQRPQGAAAVDRRHLALKAVTARSRTPRASIASRGDVAARARKAAMRRPAWCAAWMMSSPSAAGSSGGRGLPGPGRRRSSCRARPAGRTPPRSCGRSPPSMSWTSFIAAASAAMVSGCAIIARAPWARRCPGHVDVAAERRLAAVEADARRRRDGRVNHEGRGLGVGASYAGDPGRNQAGSGPSAPPGCA